MSWPCFGSSQNAGGSIRVRVRTRENNRDHAAGRRIEEEDVERFRCLLGDCTAGRSARQLPQWPQWVKYRNSLRALYTVGDYNDDPARLRRLDVPALVVTGAQTIPFHRMINEALIRALPRAEALQLGAGHNSPVADPDHFVTEWRKFERRADAARAPLR